MSQPRERIVILGGGPGGYEAALVAAQHGAQVTVVDSDGLGGACVLTDCVPSKTLIASSTTMSVVHGAEDLGIRIGVPPVGGAPGGAVSGRASAARGSAAGAPAPVPGARMPGVPGGRPGRGRAYVDAPRLYARIKALAQAQSADVALRLAAEGVEIISDRGALDGQGFVEVDRVSRTTARGVYAAGDCTGVMMLASVAAMQGRIAMWHTLGEAVQPIRLDRVAATIFTDPEIATVGVTAVAVESGAADAVAVKLPLATGAVADRGSDGPHVRGLPVAVGQPDRGGPPAHAPRRRRPLTPSAAPAPSAP